ncbi:MAG TPA: DivIVA domain-containing protein [Actinomycetes bacterium]|nr:DivIVA domain-containing protein [Actinomycetes bacterium]
MPPLTPLDIQHKEFTKAMRGYAMAEVDTFLDQVTEEFTRLQEENQRLKEQLAHARSAQAMAPAAQPPPPPPAYHQPPPPPTPETTGPQERVGEEAIARALVMAQQMADQTVEEAKARAKAILDDADGRARATSEETQRRAREITESAQLRAREVTQAAEQRAREITEAAQARARDLTEGVEARAKERIENAERRARTAEDQARTQIQQVTEQVARRRQELEGSVEALRAFERDYRARLRGFVEGQLKALEDAAPSGPVAPPPPPGLGGRGFGDDLPAVTGAGRANNSYQPLRPGPGEARPGRP